MDAMNTTSTFSTTNGVGLGLSLTKRLLEIQGGKVYIKSQQGVYTQITMTIRVETRQEPLNSVRVEENFIQIVGQSPIKVTKKRSSGLNDCFGGILEEKKIKISSKDGASKHAKEKFKSADNVQQNQNDIED